MIVIADKVVSPADLAAEFNGDSFETGILNTLISSGSRNSYDSLDQLKFELRLRKKIIDAATELNKSGLNFSVFRKTKCNPAYWNRAPDGGFVLKNGVRPSDAIRDIYINGSMYATECATAMMIVYYKALLDVYADALFNEMFPRIELMNWHRIDRLLSDVGTMTKREDYLPGDRRYFINPDVDPLTPEWQGENVIDLGNGLYYGHGLGIHKADTIIRELNENRVPNADDSARLLDTAGRPDFKNLANIYMRGGL